MGKWRASIESVDPNDLRVWLDGSREAVADRSMDSEHWRNYDAARRFQANPEQHRIHMETWLTRRDCYFFARHHVRLARIMLGRNWEGIGPCFCSVDDQLEAVGHLAEAMRMRELAREKWPEFHDHPVHDEHLAGVRDGNASVGHAEQISTRKPEQEALALFSTPDPVVSQYHIDKWAAESAARRARREAIEAKWAAQEAQAAEPVEQSRPFAPGDALILNGPATSGWANSMPRRPWVVMACDCTMCADGSQVALDVPTSPSMLDLYPESGPWRHVGAGALRRRGELSRKQAEAWGDALAMGCGVGQAAHWAHEAGNGVAAQVAIGEFAALALCDALGGLDATDEQCRQLSDWRETQGRKGAP